MNIHELLGIEWPIIQAPMAGTSTPDLAAAVSNVGGMGSIGFGSMTAQNARTAIAAIRERTEKPFNVNVFCHRPARREAVREQAWLERLRPEFARFGAAPPAEIHEPYKSFLLDRTMLDLLLEMKPNVVSFHFGLPDAGWIKGSATLA